MTKLAELRLTPVDAAQPRAIGALRLTASHARGASQIAGLRQSGSLKLLFPRPVGVALEAVILNTAGGLTGGDRMQIEVTAEPAAHVILSSQAAERAYRALGRSCAEVAVRLQAGAGARLDWLPQETILFEGAALARTLQLDLHPTARALLVEPVIFGRKAMGEVVHDAWLHDRWELRVAGKLCFADALRLTGDLAAQLSRAGVAGGAGAMAVVLYAGPDAAAFLPGLRALLPPTAGASLIRDGILFARMLAADGFELRKALIPVLEYLGGAPLPKVWRL